MAIKVYTFTTDEVYGIIQKHLNVPGRIEVRPNFNVETVVAENSMGGKAPGLAMFLTGFSVAVQELPLPAEQEQHVRKLLE